MLIACFDLVSFHAGFIGAVAQINNDSDDERTAAPVPTAPAAPAAPAVAAAATPPQPLSPPTKICNKSRMSKNKINNM